jgi:biotin carboxyl carrier protein
VNGRRYSVALWVPDVGPVVVAGTAAAGAGGRPRPKAAASSAHGGAAGAGQVTVPMQGTIVKVLVKVGDAVEVGRPLCVLEAMKMENNIEAGTAGTVSDIRVEPGSAVGAGDVVMVIE